MTNELVTVYGTVRPSVDDGRRADLTATRSTYRDAYDALTARVPEDWILLGVSTWPLHTPETDGVDADSGVATDRPEETP